MAKRKAQGYKLTAEANKRLNKYLTEIRRGIENVSEMHKHDSAPSMSQADFEITYIDKILGQAVTAVSASMRSMAEALAKQKESALTALTQGNIIPEKGTEDIQ